MNTWKLVDGDISFDENGELQMVSDEEELKQAIEFILSIRLGEFFLDETVGLNRDNLLTKQFDEDLAHADIVAAVMQEDRVDEVSEVTFTLDKATRILSVDLTILSTSGQTVTLEGVNVGAG
jgi:phage baseplate assembly protein W